MYDSDIKLQDPLTTYNSILIRFIDLGTNIPHSELVNRAYFMANFDPSDPLDLCIYNIYTTYPHLALTIERLNDILMRRIKNASEDMTKEQAICKYQDQLFKSLEEQKRQMAL